MAASDLLSDKAIQAALKAAAFAGKPKKLSDGAGLVLDARPTGVGWWRLRFWRDGKEGMLSLGTDFLDAEWGDGAAIWAICSV
ncbi:MAG: DUF4102 domain-containing protein [Sphingobacteriales bacterium]|nr:MAG: DUF4102 domain-containing protein [Sphingobacteriales bacterium]